MLRSIHARIELEMEYLITNNINKLHICLLLAHGYPSPGLSIFEIELTIFGTYFLMSEGGCRLKRGLAGLLYPFFLSRISKTGRLVPVG